MMDEQEGLDKKLVRFSNEALSIESCSINPLNAPNSFPFLPCAFLHLLLLQAYFLLSSSLIAPEVLLTPHHSYHLPSFLCIPSSWFLPLMLISGRAVGPCPAFFPLFATTSLLPFQKLSSPWTQRITPPILSTWGLELFFSSEKGYHTSNQQRLRRLLREFFVGSCPGFCTEVGLFQSYTMQVCKIMDSVRC